MLWTRTGWILSPNVPSKERKIGRGWCGGDKVLTSATQVEVAFAGAGQPRSKQLKMHWLALAGWLAGLAGLCWTGWTGTAGCSRCAARVQQISSALGLSDCALLQSASAPGDNTHVSSLSRSEAGERPCWQGFASRSDQKSRGVGEKYRQDGTHRQACCSVMDWPKVYKDEGARRKD